MRFTWLEIGVARSKSGQLDKFNYAHYRGHGSLKKSAKGTEEAAHQVPGTLAHQPVVVGSAPGDTTRMLHCNRSRTYDMSRTMKQRSLLSLLLLIATTDSSTSSGSVAKCSLTCHNQGICTVGNATFKEPESNLQLPTFHTTNANGQYCFCQPGWTGTTCDTFFESCGSNGAGCLNGGNCVKGLVDDYGNPQYMCDCSNATDSSGFPYVGKYCEHPFTAYCNTTKETFCVNGGECDQKYP